MKNYVIINGVNSNTITGLAINELPPISKPPLRTLIEEIDGRDGDLITELGYGAYDKVMTIGLYHTFDIDQIIAFFNGSGTIVFSNEPDKKYNFKIIDQIDYESLIKFRTATITLHCQPFKYPISETPIETEYDYITETGTNLTLNNTKAGKMELTYKGNTQQDSTTGKNLNYLQNLKWITNSSGEVVTNNSYWNAIIDTTNNNSIYISGNYSLLSDGVLRIGLYSSYPQLGSQGTRVTYNGNSALDTTNCNYVLLCYGPSTGHTIEEVQNSFMVSYGTTMQPYEPYTNGASPNPDYPQEIHNVSGDNTIEICGKNLFNKNTITTSAYLKEDGTLQTGTGAEYITSDFIPVQPNTTYYKTLTLSPRTKFYDANKQVLDNSTYQDISIGGNEGSFTTPSNAYYFRFTGNVNTTTGININTTMVHKGSTSSEYEAYTGQSQLISLGVENLLPSEIRQGNTTSTTATNRLFTTNGAYLKANQTYIISTNIDTSSFYWATRVASSQFPTNADIETGDWNTTNSLIYTPTQNCYLAVIIGKRDLNANISVSDIGNTYFQIEKGTKANSYSEYGKPYIELNKISTYQDYIYKENDKWYLHKEIGKVVLDGSEDGWGNDSNNKLCGLTISDIIANSGTSTTIPSYCNYYRPGGLTNSRLYEYNFCIYGGKLWFNNQSKSLADFKVWVGTNNLIVYYPLATPTNTEITDTTLLEQLETIKKSYEGITNISQDNNDEPFELEVTAETLNSGIAYINNIGNIYSKPKIDIEGNGVVNVSLNNEQLFSVNVEEEIIIDSTNLEAYKPDGTLQNRQVTGNIGNLKLPSGTSTISFSGDLGKATITDYTRWL